MLEYVLRDGLEMTEMLKNRIDAKIGKVVGKLGPNLINSATVTLKLHKFADTEKHSSTTKKDSQIAEIKCVMKGGAVIEATESTEDMYTSIDLASHTLARNLKKHRAQVKDVRGRPKIGGNQAEDEIDEDGALLAFDESTLLEELDAKYRPR